MKQARIGELTMKQLRSAVLALAIFLLASVASAQSLAGYMTVDAVSVGGGSIRVTGVVQGDVASTTRTISFPFTQSVDRPAALEACHRMLLLALSKPGQYVVYANTDACTVALVKP